MDVNVMADRARRAEQWSVVRAASSARFHVRDKLVATVHGTLPITGGVVVLAEGGTVVRAGLDLDVQGIDTGNRRRDKDLQKPRFLSVATSPSVRIDVRDVSSAATGWTATAVVYACGRSAPLDLSVQPLVVFGALDDPSDDEVRIRVTGRLDRTPLGIKVPHVVIGRFVDVEANLVFRRDDLIRDVLNRDGAEGHDRKAASP